MVEHTPEERGVTSSILVLGTMLLVRTKIGPSKIHGTGLFATEFISKGVIIWKYKPGFDEAYTQEEAEKLPEPKRTEILNLYHPYISQQTGRYISFGDMAGYINHSSTPNMATHYEEDVEEDINTAARDIAAGEELTINYQSFSVEGPDFKL